MFKQKLPHHDSYLKKNIFLFNTQKKGTSLVGGFNPSENIRQIGNFPQVGEKIKNI